ncbi:MAG: acetoacetate--CoA ligase [Oceanospirillaceae bacterium]|nr:acetoacetate--CoA ligase [Oceanospirillaceae bacterium]
MQTALWQPDAKRIKNSNLYLFQQFLKQDGHKFADYAELHKFSIKHPQRFWEYVWKFSSLIKHTDYSSVLKNADKMPGAVWFEGMQLNFAQNLLRYRDNRPALIFYNENGLQEKITYQALYAQVASLALHLKNAGVGKGDRVAGFMPNMPQTVIAMLAATSLGAIWSSCSPDFGEQGVLDRFGQIQPKVLFCADGYLYAGKKIDSLNRVNHICAQLPDLQQLIVVPYLNNTVDLSQTGFDNSILFSETQLNPEAELTFTSVPFDHPLYIMYSSGTTGVPKCIVHGTGGTLLQHFKELSLHTDVTDQDVLFYYTTCGWMMWNWLVSGLMTGAALVLFDGSPFHPAQDVLWNMAEAEKISIFGTSAKYIAALEKAGIKPAVTHQLPKLKSLLSTGSPLAHEGFDFVYRDIKADICLSSISGGTDIISCFALGNPTLPVWRGELQCKGLGMDVQVFNESGQSICGEKGELVCCTPFPSMPVGFWNDADGSKYHAAYFSRFANIWAHGDYAEITAHNGLVIHGRSDAVLNPGGVRIGTAEIYRQVEKIPQVLESIAIGQQWQDDVRVVLFVVLRDGVQLSEELIKQIKTTIRQNTTPRHVPAKILQVADIPRTISGKIVELAVRNVVHGEPVKNTDALKNPQALDLFKDLQELQS